MLTNQTLATENDSQHAPDHETALSGDESKSLDTIFEVLKNRRRWLVLRYLKTTSESASIGELAEHIAAIENDIKQAELGSQQRKRVYISLYQSHLPKMDDAGVIQFDQNRGRSRSPKPPTRSTNTSTRCQIRRHHNARRRRRDDSAPPLWLPASCTASRQSRARPSSPRLRFYFSLLVHFSDVA